MSIAVVGEFVTVSAGVATVSGGARFGSPEVLIAAADAALYEAKRSGKDRVLTWSDRNAQNAQIVYNDQSRLGRPTGKGGC